MPEIQRKQIILLFS